MSSAVVPSAHNNSNSNIENSNGSDGNEFNESEIAPSIFQQQPQQQSDIIQNQEQQFLSQQSINPFGNDNSYTAVRAIVDRFNAQQQQQQQQYEDSQKTNVTNSALSNFTSNHVNSAGIIVPLTNDSIVITHHMNNGTDYFQPQLSINWTSTHSTCEAQFSSPVYLTSLAAVAAVTDLVTTLPQNFHSFNPCLRLEQKNETAHFSASSNDNKGVVKRKSASKRKRFQQCTNKAIDEDPEDSEIPNMKQPKIMSPFAPEATVPLPFQLNNFGCLGTTIWKRNERERYRVRCVNEGYERLRSHLPISEHDKRLSKVDTLRLAIYYIHHLQFMLYEDSHASHCNCFVNFNAERNDASTPGGTGSSAE